MTDRNGAGGESGAVGEGLTEAGVGRQTEAGRVERVGRVESG